jgi:UDP-N-acetylmuramoyl-tripeptide--D-alanyl-D-alanine ligase
VLSTPRGDADIQLPLPGRHNIANALAAAAVALALDVPLETIVAGLQQVAGVAGRLRREVSADGWTIIDDSYNANPSSVAAAIDTLLLATGERWLVLGDMAELGADARELHAQLGKLARERGVERLFAVGPLGAATVAAFGAHGAHFDNKETLITVLKSQLHAGVTCLVKGSRSAGMEQVVAALGHREGDVGKHHGGASDAA